jgi:hypothetical protein
MYSNYQSLRPSIEKEINNQQSVLNKFPDNISRLIVQACAKHLAQFTSSQLPFNYHSSKIDKTSSESSNYSNRDSHYFQPPSATTASILSGDLNNDKYNFIVLDTSEQINWVLEVCFHSLFSSLMFNQII